VAAPVRFNQDGSAQKDEGGRRLARVRRLPLSHPARAATIIHSGADARKPYVAEARSRVRLGREAATKSPGAFAPGLFSFNRSDRDQK